MICHRAEVFSGKISHDIYRFLENRGRVKFCTASLTAEFFVSHGKLISGLITHTWNTKILEGQLGKM